MYTGDELRSDQIRSDQIRSDQIRFDQCGGLKVSKTSKVQALRTLKN